MFFYFFSFVLTVFLSFGQVYAQSEEISQSNLKALKVISARKGLTRLDFNTSTKEWSYFSSGMLTRVSRYFSSKNRLSIIGPLEQLVKELKETYWVSVSEDPELFHTLRRTYSSLASLYSFYKINANTDIAIQSKFITRFSKVLAEINDMLSDIERKMKIRDLYKPMPWFGELGVDLDVNDQKLGLNYLDMGANGLAELNANLQKIGNDNTHIDRAMEFYPSKYRETQFKSSISETITKKPVIFVVHGTFAANSPEYLSDQHILFQQTKYMAQSIANDQNVPVEIYSFGWSGANSNEVRIDAGEELANFVNTYFPKEEYTEILVGHSHGGNVIFHFAKAVRYIRTPHMVITLATPIRKDFITDNVNYLFQFYTEGDMIQYAGSFEITNRNETNKHTQSSRKVLREDIEKLGYFANNTKFDEVKIFASKVLHNKNTPSGMIKSHSDLKYLIGGLPRVIDSLLMYEANSEFVLNIELDEQKALSITEMDRLKFQIEQTHKNGDCL